MNRVLISGGSRGIGAALVRAFAQNGDAAECFIAHSGVSPPLGSCFDGARYALGSRRKGLRRRARP